MAREIIYKTKGGAYLTEEDVLKAAVANGDEWTPEYWKQCKGILFPTEPTVAYYLAKGEQGQAVFRYRDAVGCTIKEAQFAVYDIYRKMMNGEWENEVL